VGLRDRLEENAARLSEGARRAAASAPAQRLGESFHGLREVWRNEDGSVSVEGFLLALVRAVRDDEEAEGRSRRDVYVEARKRRRRLGLLAFGTGPLVGVANQLADLYCETALLCDVAEFHGLELSDEQIAARMLVLWSLSDDLDSAEGAIGSEPALADLLGARLLEFAGERLPDELTTRSAINAVWDARGALQEAGKGTTSGAVRTVAFTGHRTKKLIKKAEAQLGVGK
jgi:hypothetical protein